MLSIKGTFKTENKTKKRLSIKGWKMMCQANMNGKKIGVSILYLITSK